MVAHGHFQVNGRKVVGAVVPGEGGRRGAAAADLQAAGARRRQRQRGPRARCPQWLELDVNEKKGVVRSLPLREDIQIPVQEQLIVELYSK